MRQIIDPGLYRKLSEPFPDANAMNSALNAFSEELRSLREKHHIADLIVISCASYIDGTSEVSAIHASHNGDPMMALPLLAHAYGAELERHKNMIESLATPKRRKRE